MELEIHSITPEAPRPTPLLFIHGMWHGAWCWDKFLDFFAQAGYPVTALSLRGHGRSGGSIRGSRITDYVLDVEQVARKFKTPPVLIGHSMGGFITQKYLETHTAPAAVLLATNPHFGLWRSLARMTLHNPFITLRCILEWRLYPVVEHPADARWALFSDDLPEEELLAYHRQMNDESFRMFLDLLGLNLAHPERIRTPLLMLGAEKDTVITPRDIRDTARAYGVEAQIFPNMGHDMQLEPGWNAVAERILNWLQDGDSIHPKSN